jgi:two-component system response regulator VicR
MPGILVVEDDENLNRGITFSLKKSGYEVFSAESMFRMGMDWNL